MEDYLLAIFGIAISIGLFLLGYRQTIGAKKERITSANTEVEKVLVRRIVLESYTPSLIDISRLLEGKARDFRVRVGDLLSESQILNWNHRISIIFTRIIETDLISQTQREEILSRLIPSLTEAESAPVQEQKVIELPVYHRKRMVYQIVVPLAMALVASILGGFVTLLPKIGMMKMDFGNLVSALTATVAVSLGIISALYLFYRLRESQQEVTVSSSSSALEQAISFEREVAKAIEKKGLKLRPAGPRDRGYDFAIEHNGKKVLIEVKAWTRPMPIGLLSKTVDVLDKTVQIENAEEGIIVTKTPVDLKNIDLPGKKIRIMTLRELRNYLAHSLK